MLRILYNLHVFAARMFENTGSVTTEITQLIRTIWPHKTHGSYVLDESSGSIVLLRNPELVGIGIATETSPHKILLSTVGIHPEHRGKGLGSLLCDRLESLYTEIDLTYVAAENAAVPFWEHRGYTYIYHRSYGRKIMIKPFNDAGRTHLEARVKP